MASSATVMTSQEALDAILSDTLPRQGRWSDEEYLWLTDRPERDLVDKRADYAEAGIPEYWIVRRTRIAAPPPGA